MKTNSPLSGKAAPIATTGQTRWDSPALSLPNRSAQPGGASLSAASLRIPVVPENRAYLKMLRQAELAAWKTAAAPKDATPRLPSAKPAAGEDRLYALLALLSFLVLGTEFWSVCESAPQWSNFVEFVRHLLT